MSLPNAAKFTGIPSDSIGFLIVGQLSYIVKSMNGKLFSMKYDPNTNAISDHDTRFPAPGSAIYLAMDSKNSFEILYRLFPNNPADPIKEEFVIEPDELNPVHFKEVKMYEICPGNKLAGFDFKKYYDKCQSKLIACLPYKDKATLHATTEGDMILIRIRVC